VTRYRDAGVDLSRSAELKARMGPLVSATWGPGVRRLAGGFAGIMEWPAVAASGPGRLLVAASMDGVGTKLHLARDAGRLADAAADLVYHGANDLLVHNARPFAFLDYIAAGRLDPDAVLAVVEGLARACREVGAALIGGETAEMPDTYLPGQIDVAGCAIGSVVADAVLDGGRVAPGDVVLGLGSNGLHTNGFSLARRVLADSGLALGDRLPGGGGESVGDALLAAHRWYGPALDPPLARGAVKALAHVTGGGLAGNLARVLPAGARARLRAAAWPRPAVFRWIVEAGQVPEEDARTALNLGIGMVVVCGRGEARELARQLAAAGETVPEVGEIVAGERGVEWNDGR
jgi:phosphoribosylformylglycinamidine cyclo-ligase